MMILTHKFVNQIPEILEDNVIYVSIPFETVIHKCCCGCGREVITPLSPTDWSLTFDGETITLNPSIGNWNFECKSHYFIRNNKVVWARKFNKFEIKEIKEYDIEQRQIFYSKGIEENELKTQNEIGNKANKPLKDQSKFRIWLSKLLSCKKNNI